MHRLVRAVAAQLRRRFGLWVVLEARNRVRFAVATWRWRRFEDAEVRRLTAQLGSLPQATTAVIMPTYERPELLATAVASALAQDADIVVLIVDDGGGLGALPDDPRVTAVSLSRNSHVLGLVRNVGIRLTRSRYIAFLDDDNTWAPNHVSVAVAALEQGADLVYTAVERIRPDGTAMDVLSREFSRREFADASGYIDVNSVAVRRTDRTVFSRIPRTRRTLPKEDWEFIYRMSGRSRVTHVPTVTVRYLVNPDSFYTSWNPGASEIS